MANSHQNQEITCTHYSDLSRKVELLDNDFFPKAVRMASLSNGRKIVIESEGLIALEDVDIEDRESLFNKQLKHYVSWAELLGLLDRIRAEGKN